MATHLSVVFDQRKKRIYHSIFQTPITGFSRISQTQFSEKKQKKISGKEATAQLKLVQEWLSMKTKNVGTKQSGRNFDDEFLEVQPFVEEPVLFNFGDDYGNHFFLDLQREFSYKREHDGLFHGGRGINNAVEGIKYSSDDDIYILSSETHMINSFLRDNLV